MVNVVEVIKKALEGSQVYNVSVSQFEDEIQLYFVLSESPVGKVEAFAYRGIYDGKQVTFSEDFESSYSGEVWFAEYRAQKYFGELPSHCKQHADFALRLARNVIKAADAALDAVA